MAERLPVISVTDPQNKDSRPVTASPTASPVKKGLDRVSTVVANGAGVEVQKSSSIGSSDDTFRTKSNSSQAPRATSRSPTAARSTESSSDPLSRQITERMNAPDSAGKAGAQQSTAGHGLGIISPSTSLSRKNSIENTAPAGSMPPPPTSKDKKKGVSFFSRLIGNKKASTSESFQDHSEIDAAEDRPEGADAELFYEPVDNISFSPRLPQPPKYIRVRSQGKKKKDFDRLFLAQELHDHEKQSSTLGRSGTASSTSSRIRKTKSREDSQATWALEFSKDGAYVATGGQEKVVKVWATLSSSDDRKKHENEEDGYHGAAQSPHLRAPVFSEIPLRVFEGHTSAVLDLSWSKNNFLLSSSMDKTVRLWHVSRAECLCAFKHTDFVTSIQFHPKDDRFFLAGSLDSKLRLWSIPDKSVAFWNSVPEMITAVAFTPDGKTAIAGCVTGQCFFYETEGLKYNTQMQVKSAHGKNARGSKITGIQSTTIPPTDLNGDVKLLITSNDSRIRLYNLRDKSLEMKFKGNENTSSQIHARFSDDCRYIICGSEDKRVFIWSLTGPVSDDFDRKGRRPVEVFEAHSAATTVCAIAPTRTRQLLGGSEDPLFDICNPPPVKLVSKSEAASIHSGRFADDSSSIKQTPPATEGAGHFTRPDITPAYIARSTHPDGGIVVTADATGRIRVFRQDCAYEKRMRIEIAETSSMARAFGSSGMVRRQSSMASSKRSVRSITRKDSESTQPPRDRILSWRQGVGSGHATEAGAGRKSSPAIGGPQGASNRSSSPRKGRNNTQSHRSSFAQASHNGSSPALGSSDTPPSPLEALPGQQMHDVKNSDSSVSRTGLQQGRHTGAEPLTGSNVEAMDAAAAVPQEAWRLQVEQQIRRTQDSSKANEIRSAADWHVTGLTVPPTLQRNYSAVSDVSVLTDEASSEGLPAT